MPGGRPPGPSKDKPYKDALRRAIARAESLGEDSPRCLNRIADRHLDACARGDMQAIKEMADRLDGRVPQGHGQDDELGPAQVVIVTGVQRAGDE